MEHPAIWPKLSNKVLAKTAIDDIGGNVMLSDEPLAHWRSLGATENLWITSKPNEAAEGTSRNATSC